MDSERIRAIQAATAYPESHSVAAALKQVWHECSGEQAEARQIIRDLFNFAQFSISKGTPTGFYGIGIDKAREYLSRGEE